MYRKANPGATPSDLYFLIASDHRYGAPTMKIAERRAALGKGPVYLYYFRWETPLDGGRLKSPHTIEIPFAFDNVEGLAAHAAARPTRRRSRTRSATRGSRLRARGDPNTPKLPHWPAFDAAKRPTMVFNNESKVENDPLGVQRLALLSAMGLAT